MWERSLNPSLIKHLPSPTRWQEPPTAKMLHSVAAATEGFAGADLAALCAATVHAAVRRAAPTLLEQLDRRIAAPNQPTDAPPAPAPGAVTGRDESGQLPRPEEHSNAQPEPSAAEPAANGLAAEAEPQHRVLGGGSGAQQSAAPAAGGDDAGADRHLLDLVQARLTLMLVHAASALLCQAVASQI